jgi:hypothetical protein
MNFREIFNFRGINLWHIASSVGLNLLWTGGSLIFTFYFLGKSGDAVLILQLFLMISVFIGPFLAGLIFGQLAADGRGLTYGVIGSLGSVSLAIFLVLPSGGILGLMLAVIALAGGINGGLMSMRGRTLKK